MADVEADAIGRVRGHLAKIGKEGEEWVAKGVTTIPAARAAAGSELCPFFEQDLAGSPLLAHYRAYFSESYEALKCAITDAGNPAWQTQTINSQELTGFCQRVLQFTRK